MKVLFLVNSIDTKYVQALRKPLQRFSKVVVEVASAQTFVELMMLASSKRCDTIITTSIKTIKLFDRTLEGTANDNVGYVAEKDGLKCLLLPPLKTVYSTNKGRFLMDHYLKKLAAPHLFLPCPAFDWEPLTAQNWEPAYDFLSSCALLSIDIETIRQDLLLTSVSYTGISANGGTIRTYVIDFRSAQGKELMFRFAMLRKLNASPAPKLMQNGSYDSAYFMRFNVPLINYLHDTYHLAHCIFPELPKTLDFSTLFYCVGARYWKDESGSNLLEYNAKDTFYTLCTYLAQLHYIKSFKCEYALANYQIEFPLIYPALTCNMEGMRVDPEENKRLRSEAHYKREHGVQTLEVLTGLEGFNPGSPKQTKQLMQAVGYKEATSSDDKTLQKFAEDDPLYDRLAESIREYRGAAKAISNYYDFEQLNGLLLYALDPAGTESGRFACKKSAFWCGSQIQNQPLYCKSQYVPSDGYVFGACDYSQSESRCTAYISEDKNLMATVEESPDFHCTNASLFFGIPFEQLYDEAADVVLNKPIRVISKRVNHGANYNMGEFVLSETMGTKNIFQAAHLLGLPNTWTKLQICGYLLNCFDRAYPDIRGKYYDEVVMEIEMTGRLVGPTGWTRRTFMQPRKSKMDLNSAVAHAPQSLSVMIVNQAFYAAWKFQMENGSKLYRIKAQVHDEIVWQNPIGLSKEAGAKIQECMAITTKVKGRDMLIPTDLSIDAATWKDTK